MIRMEITLSSVTYFLIRHEDILVMLWYVLLVSGCREGVSWGGKRYEKGEQQTFSIFTLRSHGNHVLDRRIIFTYHFSLRSFCLLPLPAIPRLWLMRTAIEAQRQPATIPASLPPR